MLGLLGSPLAVLAFLPPAVVGILLARRGVLERPAAHLPLLRRVALGGLAASVLGSVPLVLASVQVLQVGLWTGLLAAAVHALSGLAGAVGFVALVAWFLGARSARSGGDVDAVRGPLRAVAAVGKRSLTCYLLQSLVMVPLLAPWALGLGVGAGTAFVAAVGVGTYLLTVMVALVLERAGRQGPAEQLLRRLTYGSPGRQPAERQGRLRRAVT